MKDVLIRPAEPGIERWRVERFIKSFQTRDEGHCLHCDRTVGGIRAGIQGLELPFPECFVLALEVWGKSSRLVGALGADVNEERTRAWIWGPWVRAGYEEHSANLFARLHGLLPSTIRRYDTYLDVANTRARALAVAAGYVESKLTHVYVARRERWAERVGTAAPGLLPDLDPGHEAEFRRLHEALFPGDPPATDEMLRRRDDQHRFFVVAEEGRLLGYLRGIVSRDPDEGYIEFVGVHPEARGRGLARRLLDSMLRWSFERHGLPQVGLTVVDANEGARSLYESVGFELLVSGITARRVAAPADVD